MSVIQLVKGLEVGVVVRRTMRILAWPISRQNPYTRLLYSNMGPDVRVDEYSAIKLIRRYALWHIHWPEAFLNIRNRSKATIKLAGLFASMDSLHWRGAKIVWTMHNFRAHDGLHPTLEAEFWRRFIPRVDGAISLSESALQVAKENFPALRQIPTTVIPHGHYRDVYPTGSVDARATLGISSSARVILFFGEVRAYKNVQALVRAFRDVTTPDALLYVVGRPNSEALAETILKEASIDSRVRVALEFVKTEDVSKFMQAADLVVLPYRVILNSGSALLALSFNRPVLVPDLGSMGDLRNDFGGEWVQTFGGTIDGRTLEQGLEWAALPRPPECPMPDKYNWQRIGAETIEFYEHVVSGTKESYTARSSVSGTMTLRR